MLRTGNTLEQTTAEVTEDMDELIAWGAANGVTFDPEKTELMHSTRRTRAETTPTVFHNDTEITPAEDLRWLGVWLDRKLSFKTHVSKWAIKARSVTNLLRGFCSTVKGPPAHAVRRAVIACVEPVLLYGSEAWYPGVTNAKGASTRTQHLTDRIDSVLKISIRAILPAWKTTPIPALHREAGIAPADQILEAHRLRFSTRLRSLDPDHPPPTAHNRPHDGVPQTTDPSKLLQRHRG